MCDGPAGGSAAVRTGRAVRCHTNTGKPRAVAGVRRGNDAVRRITEYGFCTNCWLTSVPVRCKIRTNQKNKQRRERRNPDNRAPESGHYKLKVPAAPWIRVTVPELRRGTSQYPAASYPRYQITERHFWRFVIKCKQGGTVGTVSSHP